MLARFPLATAIILLILSPMATAAPIVLDFDSPATGSDIITSPLVTPYGTITALTGELSTFADPEFTAAGAAGNNFNIENGAGATLSFDFDVESFTFIYGGEFRCL